MQVLLARFDEVQKSIRTLSADFVQTVESPLFREPMTARGQLYLTKPSSVRWEYTSPEARQIVIRGDEYLSVFPERKRAERKDIHRWSEQIFRMIGVGQTSGELERFYDIRVESAASDDSVLLVLEPKRRRVKKRIGEVRLWVDAKTLLPTRVETEDKDGYANVFRFENVRQNPTLEASLYSVQVPEGFTVTTGISGLGPGLAAGDGSGR